MNTNTKIVQDTIKNNIFTLFELDKMTVEEQEDVISKIGKIIFDAILVRVLPMLKEEELTEYEKLLAQNPDPEIVLDFFFEKIPNFMQIMYEESEKFRKEAEKELG